MIRPRRTSQYDQVCDPSLTSMTISWPGSNPPSPLLSSCFLLGSKEVERKIKVVKEDIRGAWAGMDGAKAKASKAKAAGDEGEWTAWLEKQCHLYKTLDCLETKEQRLLDEKRAEEEALQQGMGLAHGFLSVCLLLCLSFLNMDSSRCACLACISPVAN